MRAGAKSHIEDILGRAGTAATPGGRAAVVAAAGGRLEMAAGRRANKACVSGEDRLHVCVCIVYGRG